MAVAGATKAGSCPARTSKPDASTALLQLGSPSSFRATMEALASAGTEKQSARASPHKRCTIKIRIAT